MEPERERERSRKEGRKHNADGRRGLHKAVQKFQDNKRTLDRRGDGWEERERVDQRQNTTE